MTAGRIAEVRRRWVLAVVVAVTGVIAVAMPLSVFTVSYADPPHPARGIGLVEIIGVFVALIAAVSQTDAFAALAIRSPKNVGRSLAAEAHIGYVAPAIPFLVWYAWIRWGMQLDGVPDLAQAFAFAGTLVLYSLITHSLVLLCGPVWGSLLTLIAWCALMWAQHWWGPDVLGGAFATGTAWQVSWGLLLAAWLIAVTFHIKRRGTPLR